MKNEEGMNDIYMSIAYIGSTLPSIIALIWLGLEDRAIANLYDPLETSFRFWDGPTFHPNENIQISKNKQLVSINLIELQYQ